MRSVIIETEADLEKALIEGKEKGERVACMSNAGLSKPKIRLTFLPESCFTDKPSA